tara:strand:+ start:109 stop:363 length:255 start_codon:yes stop_codon:yes gene_type:complete
MVAKKRTTRRSQKLSTRFKKSPLTTTVNEAKKLGIPKPVTKAALIGIAAAIVTPAAATQLDRIPFMNIFTGYGRAIRQRLMGMR